MLKDRHARKGVCKSVLAGVDEIGKLPEVADLNVIEVLYAHGLELVAGSHWGGQDLEEQHHLAGRVTGVGT